MGHIRTSECSEVTTRKAALRKAAWIAALGLAMLACSMQQAGEALGIVGTPTQKPYPTLVPVTPSATPTPGAPSYTVQVQLDPSLLNGQDPALVNAWTAYGNARADWIRQNTSGDEMLMTGYHRSFDEEVAGRTALVLAWLSEKQVEPGLRNPYLDELVKVYQAHFIKEYTWTYFAASDWERPSGLNLRAYMQWMQQHLTNPIHIPQTLATVDVTIGK